MSSSQRPTTADRRSSPLDRIASIEQFQSYLCGYSVRTCAQYLLWIHVTMMFCLFVILLIVNSFVHAHFEVRHHSNETKYLFLINNHSLFSLDIFYTNEPSFDFREIGERIMEFILALAFTDIIMNAIAIIGLYNNRLELMIPYMVTIIWNVVCLFCLLVLEIIFTSINVLNNFWEVYFIIIVLIIKEMYRMYVLFAYYRLYAPYYTSDMGHKNLTTESPLKYPGNIGLQKSKR